MRLMSGVAMIKIAVILIALHGPDGHDIAISLDEITSVHCKLPGHSSGTFADGANAIINMTDGKFVSIRETCEALKEIIEEAEKRK
jgi:hypothetical protein